LKYSVPYRVQWAISSEPYIIVKREHLHLYDPRFRGYGMNKIAQVMFLGHVMKYRFVVLPDVFVVSTQHKLSRERYSYQEKLSTRAWVQALSIVVKKEVARKYDCCGYITSKSKL